MTEIFAVWRFFVRSAKVYVHVNFQNMSFATVYVREIFKILKFSNFLIVQYVLKLWKVGRFR